MPTITRRLVSLIALATACTDSPAAVSAKTPRAALPSFDKGGQSATEAINAIIVALNAGWAAKNAAAYAAPFAEDAEVITPAGTILSGHDAFEARHVFLFSGPLAASTQIVSANRISFLTGTIAIVDGSALLTVGSNVTRSLVRWVMEKRGGEWQIVAQQSTTIPPAT